MENNELYSAVRRIAYGYLILHIHLNIGTINFLPNWLGFFLILFAIPILAKECESVNLLVPLAKLLIEAEVLFWLNDGFLEGYFNLYIISLIAQVIGMYFHFQLLTNLAELAEKYECTQKKTLLNLRTAYTVLITALYMMKNWLPIETSTVMIVSILISFVVAISICFILFSFSKALLDKQAEEVAAP